MLRSAEVQPLFRDLCEVCKKRFIFFFHHGAFLSPSFFTKILFFMSRPKPVCDWQQLITDSLDAVCTEQKHCFCARHRPSFWKRTSGFFLEDKHNTTTNLFSLFIDEDLRRRKHDLVDDDDGRTKTMYAAFVPRSYGWVFKF